MSSAAKWRGDGNMRRPEWRTAWQTLAARRAKSQARVIAFFGPFGGGNIGNDGCLSSAVLAARKLDPTAELVCVCHHPNAVHAEHGIPGVPIHMAGLAGSLPDAPSGPHLLRVAQRPLFEFARWISIYRFLRQIDIVIVPGTGILDDFGLIPKGMPYHLFRWALTARLARARFAFVSIGAGPKRNPLSQFLMKCAVKLSSYCSYRDEVTRSYMSEIGASSIDTPVTTDIVFALPRSQPPALSSAHRIIGLGVMTYFGWANDQGAGVVDAVGGEDIFRTYIDNMATIACRILARGHSIRILIGDQFDEHAVNALLDAIQRQRDDDQTGRVIVEPIESMQVLLDQIENTDGVIATRYHNVVGALMMNRPVVSVGYGARFVDLMKGMGLGSYCHDVEGFVPDAVVNDLDELLAKWEDFSPRVAAVNQHHVAELERQYKTLIGVGPE